MKLRCTSRKIISSLLIFLFVLTQTIGVLPILPVKTALADTIVTITDPNLEDLIRETLGKPLGDLTTLDMEALYSLNGKGKGIKNLSGLEYAKNLSWINFENNLITNLTPLSDLTNVNSIYLFNNQISDINPLRSLTNLRYLNLQDNQISDLSPLSSLPMLESINLGRNNISDVSPLANIATLKSLYLSRNGISNISSLGTLVNLEYLGVEINQISDISVVSNFPKLRHLAINSNQVTDLTPISNLTQIQSLYFNNNRITDISPISNLTQLKTLYMLFNQVNNLEPLRNLSQLDKIYMYSNNVTDISPLIDLPVLKYLDIRVNPLSQAGLASIQDLINRGVSVDSGTADTTSPILTVTEPVNNLTTTNNWVKVAGYSDSNKRFSINGRPVYSYSITTTNNPYDNNFESVVYLNPGVNQITVTVTDNFNDMVATEIITVNYQPDSVIIPDPNLEAAIRTALNKPVGDITPSDMASLTTLRAERMGIVNLKGLEFATNLTSLDLDYNQISDLSPISNLTKLQYLYIFENKVANLEPLKNLTSLKGLWAIRNQITNVQALQSLTNLNQLILSVNPIQDATPIGDLTNLQMLSLGSMQLSDISFLRNLTKLTMLTLRNNSISDVSVLSGIPGIQTINLENNQISDLTPLLDLTSLRTVNVSANPLSTASWGVVSTLQSRGVTVTADKVVFNDPILEQVVRETLNKLTGDLTPADMSTITTITASNRGVTDLKGLEFASNLTTLNLSTNQVSDLKPLAGLTKLTNLVLYNNKVSDLTPLSNLTQLITLSLSANQITDIAPITNLTNLQTLRLSDNMINNLISLSNLKNLIELRLSNNPLPVTELGVLSNFTKLQRLYLFNLGISDLSIISNLTQLTDLYLNDNQIVNIAPLTNLVNLIRLHLFNNQINNISSLGDMAKLQEFKASNNLISDISVLNNLPLKTVDLKLNPLRAESQLVIDNLISKGATVEYDPITDTIPPFLSVTSPIDNSISITNTITVSGSTEQGSIVNVNGNLVNTDISGNFTTDLNLTTGVNTITITAIDAAGNISTAIRTVINYPNPIELIRDVTLSSNPYNINFGTLTINYNLLDAAKVNTNIYDENMNLIKTIQNNIAKPSGANTAIWDGKDQFGIKVPNGTYIYTIDAVDNNGNQAIQQKGTFIAGQSPVISNVSDGPDPFTAMDNNQANIQYSLNNDANVTIGIYSSQGELIRTLLDSQAFNAGINNVDWDGKDVNGNIVVDGIYTYKIDATDTITGFNAVQQKGTITVDNEVPKISNISLSQNPYNCRGALSLGFNLSETAYITTKILDSNGLLVKDLLVGTKKYAGTNLVTWDGKDTEGNFVKPGTYTYSLEAKDTVGKISEPLTGTVTVSQNPVISNISDTPDPFANDGNIKANINYTLNVDADVTVGVYNSKGELVKNLLNLQRNTVGENNVQWDGTDVNNNPVGDGIYTYKIDAIDTLGIFNTVQQKGTITVENAIPVISSVTLSQNPYDVSKSLSIGFNLSEPAYVTIKILDSNGAVVKDILSNIKKNAGLNNISWDGKGNNGAAIETGKYTYTIDAKDLSGNSAEQQTGQLTIGQSPVISNVTDNPDPFANDGSIQAALFFNLNIPANVTVGVYDSTGNLIKTLLNNQAGTAGLNTTIWDGTKDDNISYVTDGIYTYKVDAVDPVLGIFKAVQQKGTITVDNRPPGITDVSLSSNPYNLNGTLRINYNLTENSNVTIKILDQDGTTVIRDLLTNTKKAMGSNYASWDGKDNQGIKVKPGNYTYKIEAVDILGKPAIPQGGGFTVGQTPVITNIAASPATFINDGKSLAAFKFTLNTDSNVTVGIYNSQGNLIKELVTNQKYLSGENSVTWDGLDNLGNRSSNGIYTYKIDATDVLGGFKAVQQKGTITVDNGVPFTISDITLSQNPYNSSYGALTIGYNLSQNGKVTIKILDDKGNVVRALATSVSKLMGVNTTTWDGKDNLGFLLPGGTYTYTISAIDNIGNQAVEQTGTVITSRSPVISEVSAAPLSFINDGINTANISFKLSMPANVTIGIYNSQGTLLKSLATDLSCNSGINNISWVGDDDNSKLLGDGIYTYKIDAVENIAGFKAIQQKGTITIEKGAVVISDVTLSQNPYNTTYGSLTIGYFLTEQGKVSVNIYDGNGNLVRNLVNSVTKYAGTNTVNWDGKNSFGLKVPGGQYTYTIDAVDTSNNPGVQQKGTFMVSGTPVISNVSVGPNPFAANGTNKVSLNYSISRQAKVTVIITDKYGNLVKNLAVDKLQDGGAYTLEWDGSSGEINPALYPWPVVPDGVYYYTIDAVDPVVGFTANTYRGSITVEGANPVISDVVSGPKPYTGGNMTIKYDISEDSYVTLSVYKATGELVKTIMNNTLITIGTISTVWDGKDFTGVIVPTGSYYFTIDAKDKAGKLAVQYKESFNKN